MRIKKKELLYQIANLAYTVANTGEDSRHTLHRVRDICEEGNIDRVNRVLALAFSKVLVILLPIIKPAPHHHSPGFPVKTDDERKEGNEDYLIFLKRNNDLKFRLTKEIEFNIRETVTEHMVSMVLADWLAITMPEAADVWKYRAKASLEALAAIVSSLFSSSFTGGFRRKISPF